ncbi:MAG: hypothetical protein HY721_15490 [Planctomycetes bacterium]|nr:hypothetical protein [Planctomycetota bacterium]
MAPGAAGRPARGAGARRVAVGHCRDAPNPLQEDSDGDGLGDACKVQGAFVRGDATGDGAVDIADPIRTLSYLFLADRIACLAAADSNDDDQVDIADAVWTLGFLFQGGPPPPPPFPDPGFDEDTPGPLGCAR